MDVRLTPRKPTLRQEGTGETQNRAAVRASVKAVLRTAKLAPSKIGKKIEMYIQSLRTVPSTGRD